MAEIKVLALDLDGTLTNSQKEVTPRTRAALDAAIAKGVTIVLASGRPTAGVLPLAKELGLDKKGGCILSYNGGKIIDCRTGETLYQKQLDAQYVPELCAFAAAQNVTIITYNKEGVVTEHPDDKWALRECFTCKLPMTGVDDLAKYVGYPICKMLITLDPARRDEVWAAGKKQFDGRIDLLPRPLHRVDVFHCLFVVHRYCLDSRNNIKNFGTPERRQTLRCSILRISYFFASFIRLRFSSRMRSSTTFTALRMRAFGMRTASVAHG